MAAAEHRGFGIPSVVMMMIRGADRSGVVEVRSALPPTAVHAPTRVPSATHFLRTAAPYSSALHRLCLLAV